MCRNQRRIGGYNHNVFSSGNIVACCQRSGTSCCGQLVVEIAGFKSEISQTSLKVSDLCTQVASLTNSVLTKGVNSDNTCEIGVQTETCLAGYDKHNEECFTCRSNKNELYIELEGVKLEQVILQSKLNGRICSNTDMLDQTRAEVAIIRKEYGEIIERVNSLNKVNENTNNIAAGIVRLVELNKEIINNIVILRMESDKLK